MKKALKFVFLLVLFAVLFILPAIILPVTSIGAGGGSGGGLALLLLLIADVSALVFLLQRLRLRGVPLLFAVVFVFWGLQTFMTQIETWFFREAMPSINADEMRNLFIRPLITLIIFVPLAMWILGRWNGGRHTVAADSRSVPLSRVVGLSLAYVIVYFVFGYYVAWQFEAVRVFYDGVPDKLTFVEQTTRTIREMPWIVPFQFLRGFLWVLFGLPVILWLDLERRARIVACAVLYSLPALQLIIDNPFMPEAVRMAHLLEVGTSNALFGWLVGMTLVPDRSPH